MAFKNSKKFKILVEVVFLITKQLFVSNSDFLLVTGEICTKDFVIFLILFHIGYEIFKDSIYRFGIERKYYQTTKIFIGSSRLGELWFINYWNNPCSELYVVVVGSCWLLVVGQRPITNKLLNF
ncbi:hypothetical protein BpHYR1_048925 [Brachionus plicatilis]|uniref:Uncharacterized protein n=1 Tax=Brachionus plicatilis TaxID=10195 RepID=A0A3M7PVI9_BRAPC|nr:hypothetical protein BpHYR1_048925 [Brachionus plicatilis]